MLVVISGPELGLLRDLPLGGELLIGRDEHCEMQLGDISVSRQHARLRENQGQVSICDLGSRNGTWVQGERLHNGEEFLVNGAQIQIGITTLKFAWVDALDLEFQKRMQETSLVDLLTGVHNRRWFGERLEAEVAAAQRHGGELALLMIDIDFFKHLNHQHGYEAGDAVLKQVAVALESQLRREDMLARYGGEEFVVLARATNADGAETLGERLREAVEAVVLHEGDHVTVSIGIGQFTPGMVGAQLVESAEAGVYRAKHRGRNRVVLVRY